jgi:hypothetical protein
MFVYLWVLGSIHMQGSSWEGRDIDAVVLCQLMMVVIMNSELGKNVGEATVGHWRLLLWKLPGNT